jgi:hypothetical protein
MHAHGFALQDNASTSHGLNELDELQPSPMQNQLISEDSYSGMYMWEPTQGTNQIEFEQDLIASTNYNHYSHKRMLKYESEYYREPLIPPPVRQQELSPALRAHFRNSY